MNLVTFTIDEVIIYESLILVRQDKCIESFSPDQVYSIRKGILKVYEDKFRLDNWVFEDTSYYFRKIKNEYYYVILPKPFAYESESQLSFTLPMYTLIDTSNRIWVHPADIKPLSYWQNIIEEVSEKESE